MKFWSTSETTEDIGEQLSSLRRKIEVEINTHFNEQSPEHSPPLTWAIIFVCVSEEFLDFFSETLTMRKKSSTIEHRLQINHSDFLNASEAEKLTLMMNTLRRSVNYMEDKKFNICDKERSELNKIINAVENKIRSQISA